MSDALARHGDRFAARVFTVAERAYADGRGNRDEAYAARFAAKEATSKALGAPRGIGWHDVEVIPAVTGERGPTVVLRGRAREVAEQRGVAQVMISITHAGGVAAAVAIAVGT
ncbi:MAG: holo-ACP synthase [Deltaproteobacteria bacterium]|nr:holo-ACP synthase [Nannocystaceae bacterium]